MIRSAIAVIAALLLAPGRASPQSGSPADDSLRTTVMRAADIGGGVGVVVGLLDANGTRRVIVVGDTTWNGRTLFEIGSITKVFTGILLADAVERGEVRLDQPLRELLPDSIRVPARGGREITLLNLATHTSGLPRMPDNFRPADWKNPYADYSVGQLYAFLDGHSLRRDIGETPVYSNYGAALLGHVLARRAGMTYADLVRTRVLQPLRLANTMIAIPDSLRLRIAPGFDPWRRRTSAWDLAEAFAGAGALRSGADDMLTFVAAVLAPDTSTTLGRAIRRSTTRHEVGGWRGGLFWSMGRNAFGRARVAHGGGTGGYSTFIGFDPERHVGVVVLSNANSIVDVQRLGVHLLDPRVPASTKWIDRGFTMLAVGLVVLAVAGIGAAWRGTGAPRRTVAKVVVRASFAGIAWLGLTWIAARFGVLSFDSTPPSIMLMLVLTTGLALWIATSRVGGRLATMPLALLVGVQGFRLPLELIMHRAFYAGLLPPALTWTGWNFDIVTGISALIVAALVAAGRAGTRTVRAWNWIGSLLLVNVVVLSILSAPGPLRVFRTSPANTWILAPPYVWVPTVMVAFAILGHVVIFRRLASEGSVR